MYDTYNEYWETEEFEDLVTRSLVGMFETKVKKEKRAPKSVRFDEDIFKRARKLGCYFPAGDRVIVASQDENGVLLSTQSIDILNDGLPEKAVFTQKNEDGDNYLHGFYLEKVPFLPQPFSSKERGTFYRITQIYFTNKYVTGCGTFIVVDKEGNITSCYIKNNWQNPITNKFEKFENRPMIMNPTGGCNDFYSVWGAVTIQIYQDRQYLWNVQAQDEIAKATFTVYPEQIKSLFYARELPQTEFGRKKPILHWVSAHQRRMKSGTEFDVDKYLRGTHEFTMNGTKFKITNPMKNIKVNNADK